jgi:hypothetical protein
MINKKNLKISFSKIFVLSISLTFILLSCSSPVYKSYKTTGVKYPATSQSVPVTVFDVTEAIPPGYQNIGTVRIGDSGWSVNCGYNAVLLKATNACRKMGGTALKIVTITEPDFIGTTCYRLFAYVLREE